MIFFLPGEMSFYAIPKGESKEKKRLTNVEKKAKEGIGTGVEGEKIIPFSREKKPWG